MRLRPASWRLAVQALCTAAVLLGAAAHAQAAETSAAPAPAGVSPCPPQAPELDAARREALARQSRDRGLLWRIDYQGRRSWLYATVHVGQPEWLFPGPRIASALQASDSLLLELDLSDPATVAVLQKGMSARPDAPALPPALAQRLQHHLAAACAQSELQPLRTEAQVISLQLLAGRSHGLFAEFGVDAVLAGMAKAWNKPIRALESAEDQIKLLTLDDPAQLQESVESALTQLENHSASQSLVTAARAWEQGDSRKLAHYAQWCNCVNTALDRKALTALLDDRNPGMAHGIAAQLRAGRSVFAAVGALHLVGAKGLPALLRQQGFDVQPVSLHSERQNQSLNGLQSPEYGFNQLSKR